MSVRKFLVYGGIYLAFFMSTGCFAEPASEERPRSELPVAPLVYTEKPDYTPKKAAIRERRLLYELVQESEKDRDWGNLEATEASPKPEPMTDSTALGKSILDALIERDPVLWERLFIENEKFYDIFPVRKRIAVKRVREAIESSEKLWNLFDVKKGISLRKGGLAELLTFKELELGVSRNPRGEIVGVPISPAEYWNNKLVVGLANTSHTFEFDINRIARFESHGEKILRIAGPINIDDGLETFLKAGLHLKAKLMRSEDYPYPLRVGNFWYYSRHLVEKKSEGVRKRAREHLVEVESVEKYDYYRIVDLRHSYDDARLTKVDVAWIVTPRLISYCLKACRQSPEELATILTGIQNTVPHFSLPISRGKRWSALKGKSSDNPAFRIDEEWVTIETSAGHFEQVTPIHQVRAWGKAPIWSNIQKKTTYFANGIGVIKNRIETSEAIIEERLTNYRISP